jgi:hypothetical protein
MMKLLFGVTVRLHEEIKLDRVTQRAPLVRHRTLEAMLGEAVSKVAMATPGS